METAYVVETADGSNTFFSPQFGEHYHSIYGAVNESRHVFINAGLVQLEKNSVSILEVGFGTGLNFLLSLDHCHQRKVALDYIGIEPYPLPVELLERSGYDAFITPLLWQEFVSNYDKVFLKEQTLLNNYCLRIIQSPLIEFSGNKKFDIIYFDAFSSQSQPELWTHESLAHACSFLKEGGCLVTYSVTGNLKNIFKRLGYTVERLPGAPGKREMLRASR